MRTIDHIYIDGVFVSHTATSARASSIQAPRETIGYVVLADEEDALRAVAAKKALPTFSQTTG